MRIVNFLAVDQPRLGFLVEDRIFDPLAAENSNFEEAGWFASTSNFITAGDPARTLVARMIEAGTGGWHSLSGLQLMAPIRPTTILCAGSNYRAHNLEKASTPLSGLEPEFFVKTADCVIGPGEFIVHDGQLTAKLDCETELAIVIGRPGRHIRVDQALDHVFGYTIVNDVTARDRQVRRGPGGMVWYDLARGKAFDTSAPLGPVIVTADEIGDPQSLRISTRINGELRQSSSTTEMIWSCAELIHFFSTSFTLRPGMVIITGTPAGTAWSNDPELGGRWQPSPGLVPAARYCLPGDVVECQIEKIGTLTNTVAESTGLGV
ncbi:fumarylacetoacetate hydrolase family protein [Ensifer sp. ENS04]|uniref:fumarylacetoacetate hydrolase family protein n=1 Tax=Ensifer sp. ENS04 TaxID=2769281 RepID=UPI00177D41B7|nr:fumarylacetoacetate hydrolase family protein [Ensifer sp. ENS04]MBD9541437.1 fumarylacetoacetate hydrolase family protein [Ensifer sp. ENS04]